ncbi:MAG: molybdenum cofactor guanylyltransferase [Salinirussus sp.]
MSGTTPAGTDSRSADRAGVVLAGGGSTRFDGGDKALAPVDGEPMLVRVVDRVGAAVDGVVVSCRPAQRGAFRRALAGNPAVALAVDPVPDEGPLAGLRAALSAVGTRYAAVVACDMPAVDPGFLRALFERARDNDAAVPVASGTPQPAQAVYRVPAMIAAAERRLSAGRRSLRGALAGLDAVEVDPSSVGAGARRSLVDVNTRADLRAFDPAADTGEEDGRRRR